ncbi:protein kinase domain-containing protein [Clostridium pasteurianum]|uniref:Protein kinase family protein n=1 Tax=Clostridium pasteurianum BC1 TaxID=86416 RepID=R4K3F8_CLOPA|nr:protein kinase [Clostridium pasteurianum]AGK97113.1 protein kinase family protein [Clostridium pasteurianum BC1]
MNKITDVTRRDILDIIRVGFNGTYKERKLDYYEHEYIEEVPCEYKMCYHGRLSEIDFLSRIYDLKSMKSTDSRFRDAESDIWQHTVNNDDWDMDWVFSDPRFKLNTGSDDPLLKFLCEMFHPVVRNETQPWREFLKIINELLKPDGYELYEMSHISGRAVYGWREIVANSIVIAEHNPAVSYELKPIGEGSYAKVFKYKDNYYKRTFVLKRAKKELNKNELERFKREFEQMKALDSPYIVDVFRYNDESNEYIMEYMDCTLEKFISENNGKLTFVQRKNIASQVLRAFKYIHSKDLLHRDVCPKNVLVKLYDDVRVVKVSDFGLVKIPDSELTSVSTDYKGYFNDPELRLEGFNTYCIIHETYAITRLVVFILTGRTNTGKIENTQLKEFVVKGLNTDKTKRFQNIDELIETFNKIKE